MESKLGKKAIIWDIEGEPAEKNCIVIKWKSSASGENAVSIPKYVEEHADRLKARYLAFIYELGNTVVKGKTVCEHLEGDTNFSFWWMAQIPEKNLSSSPLIYTVLRILALEEILEKQNIIELTLFSRDKTLIDILIDSPFKIRLQKLSDRKFFSSFAMRKIFEKLPVFISGLLSFLLWLVRKWSLRTQKQMDWFSGKNSIFIFSYFIHLDIERARKKEFYSKHWESLPELLEENGKKINWLQLFHESSLTPNSKTAVDLLDSFHLNNAKGHHRFLESYLSFRMIFRAIQKWFLLCLAQVKLRGMRKRFYFSGSSVSFWPLFKKEWTTSLSGIVGLTNCIWFELFDAMLKDIPRQEIGLFLCENMAWEKPLLHFWRKHGHGSIYGIAHTTIPFWHLYYFDDPRTYDQSKKNPLPLPDLFCVNGDFAYQEVNLSGYPKGRIAKVEALRYLKMGELKRKIKTREKVDVPKEISILLLGDMVESSMENFLGIISGFIRDYPNEIYRFTIKLHPGLAVDLKPIADLNIKEINFPLDEILEGYDFVIAANCTSASVDAYMMGLPVIIVLDPADFNLNPLRGVNGVHFVWDMNDFVSAFNGIVNRLGEYSEKNNYFYIDKGLELWKNVLNIT